MATVLIPHPLRKFTDGASEVTAEGTTVGEVIGRLEDSHPGLKGKLLAEDGGVRPFVNIFLNNKDIRFLESMNTSIGDGDELLIVPALAGGIGSGEKERCRVCR